VRKSGKGKEKGRWKKEGGKVRGKQNFKGKNKCKIGERQ
jgi:hypothetical protein